MADAGEVVARITVDTSLIKEQMDEVVAIMQAAGEKMSAALGEAFSGSASASALLISENNKMAASYQALADTGVAAANLRARTIQSETAVIAAETRKATAEIRQQSIAMQNEARAQAIASREKIEAFRAENSVTKDLTETTKAHAGALGMTSTATRELLVMIREGGRGDLTRMAGSMSLFLGQFTFGKGLINAIIGPLGGFLGVVGALGYAMIKGASDQRAFNQMLLMTKNSAGLTEDSFNNLSKTLAGKTNSTLGETKAALTRIAATGEYSNKTLKLMGEAALEFGNKTGIGVDAALDKFLIADRNVARSAAELNRQYGFLSVEEAKRIKRLSDMGDKDSATAILMAAVARETEKVTEKLGYLAGAWKTVKKAASEAIDAMMNWGKAPTLENQKNEAEGLLHTYTNLARQAKHQEEALRAQNAPMVDIYRAHVAWVDAQKKVEQYTGKIAQGYKDIKTEADKAAASADKSNSTKNAVDKILQPPKADKKEKGQVTELERLKKENEELQLAREKTLAIDGKYYQTANEDAKKFWESQLGNAKLTPKELNEVNRLKNEAEMKVLKQGLDQKKALLEVEYAEAKGNVEKQRALLKQEADMYTVFAGEKSAILKRIAALDREEKAEKQRTALKTEQDARDSYLNEVLEQEGAAKDLLENGSINNKQYLKMMSDFNQKKLEAKILEIKEEAKIESQFGSGDKAADREKTTEGKILQARREFQKEKNKIDADAAKESEKVWKSIGQTMSTALTGSIEQIVMHQKNMVQSLRGIWNTMLQSFLKLGIDMAEAWAVNTAKQVLITKAGEEAKTGSVGLASKLIEMYQTMTGQTVIAQKATETTAVITDNAGQAATGAAAAVAPTPWVGPALAAAAFAATMALCMGAMHSAEGGFDIGNFEPLTQLHKKEMVLPAPLADGFRNIIQNGSSNSSSKNNVTHNNTVNMHIQATDADSFARSEIDIHRQAAQQLKRYGR